jgi:hypothetical protein
MTVDIYLDYCAWRAYRGANFSHEGWSVLRRANLQRQNEP